MFAHSMYALYPSPDVPGVARAFVRLIDISDSVVAALAGFYGAILLLGVLPTRPDPRGGQTVQGPYGALLFAWVIADFALIYWLGFRAARRPGAPTRRSRYATTQRAATQMFL